MMTRLKYLLAALLVAAGVAGPAPEPAAALLDQTITFQQVADVLLSSGSGVWTRVSSTTGFTIAVNSLTTGVCTIGGVYADEEVWEQDEPGLYVAHIRFQSAGTCRIVASQAGNSSYNPAPDVEQSFEIIGATPPPELTPQTIIAWTLPPTEAPLSDGANIAYFQSSRGLPVTLTSATPEICTIMSGTYIGTFWVLYTTAGTCTVVASAAGNDVYAAAADFVYTFSIVAPQQVDQVMTVEQIPDRQTDSGPLHVTAWSSSGLDVVLTSSTPDVCASGTRSSHASFFIRVWGPGTCTLVASQDGNEYFYPATPITRTFQISDPPRSDQTIIFGPLNDRQLSDVSYYDFVITDATLYGTLASTTPETCRAEVAEDYMYVIYLDAIGTCTLVASQAGNGLWDPAPDVTESFQILGPPECTIAFSEDSITAGALTPLSFSALTSNFSGGERVLFSGNSSLFVAMDIDATLLLGMMETIERAEHLEIVMLLSGLADHVNAGGTDDDFDYSVPLPHTVTVDVVAASDFSTVSQSSLFYTENPLQIVVETGLPICSTQITLNGPGPVTNFTTKGFFKPVKMNGRLNNGIKRGAIVPLKFAVEDAGTVVSDTSVVKSLTQQEYSCRTSVDIGTVEVLASDSTTLRYNATTQRFTQDWYAPAKKNSCYRVTVTLTDDQTITALFRTNWRWHRP